MAFLATMKIGALWIIFAAAIASLSLSQRMILMR